MKNFILIIAVAILSACGSIKNKETSFNAELKTYKYPFDVKYYGFKSQRQDLKMAYGDLGPKDSNKVALLLHGKNFSGFYWDQIARELARKGYRVIVPDQIGFGKSSKPDFYQYSFSQLAHNTMALLDSLELKSYVVVGHSMGGMLAVHLSNYDPRVTEMVLVNPIGLERYLDYAKIKDPQFFFENEKKKTVEMFRNYQRKNYYAGDWKDSYEELLTPFKGWKAGPDWERVAWNNALTYGPIFNDEIVSSLERTKVKTYLLLGTRDRTGPGRGWKKDGVDRELGRYDKLGKLLKRKNSKYIRLTEWKKLGHMPQFEDYSTFAKSFYPIFK